MLVIVQKALSQCSCIFPRFRDQGTGDGEQGKTDGKNEAGNSAGIGATKDRQIGKLREDAAQLQNQLQELRLMPDGAGDGVDTRSQVQVNKHYNGLSKQSLSYLIYVKLIKKAGYY